MRTMRGDPKHTAATSGQPEEALEPLRAAVTANEREMDPPPASFAQLQAVIAHDDARVLSGVRAQPTVVRRLTLLAELAALAGFELWLGGHDALHAAPLRVGVSLVVLAVVVVLAALYSTRPLRARLLSRGGEVALLLAPLAITLVLSLWPAGHVSGSLRASLEGALPCFIYGSVVALVVFLVARALDRGAWLSSVSAALSAGLFANFALTTHCPLAGVDHMLLGHFGVLFAALATCMLWLRARSDQ